MIAFDVTSDLICVLVDSDSPAVKDRSWCPFQEAEQHCLAGKEQVKSVTDATPLLPASTLSEGECGGAPKGESTSRATSQFTHSSLEAQTGPPLFSVAFYRLLVRRHGGATGEQGFLGASSRTPYAHQHCYPVQAAQ
jgi:hypothetical protein